MNARTILIGAILGLIPTLSPAATIDRAIFTEVVNNVRVIEVASKKTLSAKTQQEFNAPNILRTGPDSRAEMVSSDQTVTRVGQNTVFSFEPNSREVDLEKGSVLFQSPSGKGGGTIKTPSASAAVLGTTLIVTTTKNGGFKVLLVEGKGRVTAADGSVRTLNSGQLVYALPGGKLSNVFEFRLSEQVGASKLVSGFKKQLPSAGKIAAAIASQEKDIGTGAAIATEYIASGSPNYAYKVDTAIDAQTKRSETAGATRFQTAATTDAFVFAPELDLRRLFVPAEIEVSGDASPILFSSNTDTLSGTFDHATNPVTFVGSNILFATPTVNLAPYQSNDAFQFLAVNDVLFNQSLDLGTYSGDVQFLAGGTIQAAPRTIISANAKRLSFLSVGSATGLGASLPEKIRDFQVEVPLKLEDFAAFNEGGGLDLIGGDIELTHTRFGASTDLRVANLRDFTTTGLKNAALNSPNPDTPGVAPAVSPGFSLFAAGEAVNIFTGRDLKAIRTAFRAPSIRLESAGRLGLDLVQIDDLTAPSFASGSPGFGPSTKPTVRLYAADLIAMNRVNFYSNAVLLQSRTLYLQNVNFRSNSRVILESRIGTLAQVGNGAPGRPGYVNVVGNTVKYGGSPVTPNSNFVIQNGAGPTPGGPGVVVRPFLGK